MTFGIVACDLWPLARAVDRFSVALSVVDLRISIVCFVRDFSLSVYGNKQERLSGGVAPTVITATVRIIREVSATAVKALPVRP